MYFLQNDKKQRFCGLVLGRSRLWRAGRPRRVLQPSPTSIANLSMFRESNNFHDSKATLWRRLESLRRQMLQDVLRSGLKRQIHSTGSLRRLQRGRSQPDICPLGSGSRIPNRTQTRSRMSKGDQLLDRRKDQKF